MEEISITGKYTGPHAWDPSSQKVVHEIALSCPVNFPHKLHTGGPTVVELPGHVTEEVPGHAVVHGAAVGLHCLQNLIRLGE